MALRDGGILVWTATGVYVVGPNERAVVWRLRQNSFRFALPGIHFGFPWGIDRVTKLKLSEQKRVGIGLGLDDRDLGRRGRTPSRRMSCGRS